ncbi:beta-ketoacyl synthase N-terminal-like domain-containing protein [Catenulispora rubra]|uniref:beta-ketoacyl synthase N-terminal-like domain-containing protein n=1 Tax=Catenulispora rubra TaxID=280293 RepID=UPI0018921517|nr:polyketide synthase [Catenulispora rubra]
MTAALGSGVDTAEIRKLMEDQLRVSRALQARVRELEDERRAPLAVVAMGLRLPGGLDSPGAYWDFLHRGADGYSPIPRDRPGLRTVHDPEPGRVGRSYVDRAGFLADIAGFDAEFFGLSGREARLMDPQQRLLLETAWEALERGGLAARRSDRLDVGVYLGIMASEYTERFEDRADLSAVGAHYTTGGGLCFAAGRISHTMGLRGPVFSVDTACSSSLSALHIATGALRSGDCRYALVCGSNLLLSANLMVSLCQTRALAPDGRTKAFLASADGYGRGEGVGAVLLMRLADAERERRPILAVLRGTAVNHDGAASGLTVPNGPAQQEVIAAALADAGVEPGEIGFVEAHGTGTPLGDPIEIGALDAVIGTAVRARGVPLPLGSGKSRIGHLEAASGIAAVMKTVLVLHHGVVPASASPADGALNPHIDWEHLGFTVPREPLPWPPTLPRRVAGVNSFGMSGTNAHAVFEAYQDSDATGAPALDRPDLLVVSARTPTALAQLADATVAVLRDPARAADAASICHTLRAGRVPFECRLAVVGTGAADLADQLAAAARVRERPTGAPRTRTAILSVRPDSASLTEAVAVLSDRFSALAAAAPRAGAEGSAEVLAAMLSQLGLRVRLRTSDDAEPAAALAGEAADGGWTAPLVEADPKQAPELLLAAVRQAYLAGADMRFEALAPAEARFLGDLPTYPFQRVRYWAEEPGWEVGDPPGPDRRPVPAPSGRDRDEVAGYLIAELGAALESGDDLDLESSPLEAGCDSFIFQLFITNVEANFPLGLTPEDLPLDLPTGELIGRLADDIHGSAHSGAAHTHSGAHNGARSGAPDPGTP